MLKEKNSKSVVCPAHSVRHGGKDHPGTWVMRGGGRSQTTSQSFQDPAALHIAYARMRNGRDLSISGQEYRKPKDISPGYSDSLVRWKVSSTVELGS